MKNFKSVQEWLDTDPSPEVTQIVLNAINRSSAAEARKEYFVTQRKLKMVEEAIRSMNELKIKVPDELRAEASSMRKRLVELRS